MPKATARITLPDRYRVVRHVANGGMASVWEAHDELLDRPVAVKVLAGHLSEDERARRRFQREARTAAGLSSHPNVVTIFDVGEHDGRSFIVMELLHGGTLADRLRAGNEIPHQLALRWLGEAASALDAAHAAGIVHRDVKPANMLIDGRGRLALADFGIARLGLDDQITQTGQVLGTAAYISPEQALGEPAVPASDRYALAVVAFELLTATKPFRADNFAAQARAHVEAEPPPASERARDLPPAADPVLARALAKPPRERWPSADELVRRLADALAPAPPAGVSTTGPAGLRPTRPGSVARRGRGRGVGAGASIGLVAALLLAAAGFALMRPDEPPAGDAGGSTVATSKPAAGARRRDGGASSASGTRADPDVARKTRAQGSGARRPAGATLTGRAAQRQRDGAAAPSGSRARGKDPVALQLQAYDLNNAGRPAEALPYGKRAVSLCRDSNAVSPCAYALFEYARSLRATGKPGEAVAVLEERRRRFPDDQPAAVERELSAARVAARDA